MHPAPFNTVPVPQLPRLATKERGAVVAQASTPASSRGVTPRVASSGETPPELAAATAALRLRSVSLLASFVAVFASALIAARAAEPLTVRGVTEPFLDVTLSAPVPGIVSVQLVHEGDFVRKGDVILELDKRLEELEVQRRGAVMDQSKLELDSTHALLQTTRSVSKEESAKKEAQYNVAVAEHGIASEELARRRIVAPFSGSIAEINLQIGAACAPYQPLARLVDTSRGYFVGHVEGKSVSDLRTNQPVSILLEGMSAPVSGKICFISPVVDPASGLAKVKALFENADGKIRPGIAARMISDSTNSVQVGATK